MPKAVVSMSADPFGFSAYYGSEDRTDESAKRAAKSRPKGGAANHPDGLRRVPAWSRRVGQKCSTRIAAIPGGAGLLRYRIDATAVRAGNVHGCLLLASQLTTPHKLRSEARSRKRAGRRLVVQAVHKPTAEDVSFMRWLGVWGGRPRVA